MSSKSNNLSCMGKAETEFRAAFSRLKKGTPIRLEKSAPVSQNNVAKEAGCVPSALRKSRFPSLIAEIKHWIAEHAPIKNDSSRKNNLASRAEKRSLREKIKDLESQRDSALSKLLEANRLILELISENEDLKSKQTKSNVHPLR